MKSVEERLQALPRIAEESGLEAGEQLKRRILRAAEEREKPRRAFAPRLAAALCALAVLIGAGAFALPSLRGGGPAQTQTPLIESYPAGSVTVGDKLALDVPAGSISIRASRNPSYRSIWAPMSGGNFPLIGVNGR